MAGRISIYIAVFSCFIVITLSAVIPGSVKSSNADRTEVHDNKPLAISIDLSTCKCMNKDLECELVIAKSKLMEIYGCPKDQHFCCNNNNNNNKEHSKSLNSTSTAIKDTLEDFTNTTKQARPTNSTRIKISRAEEITTENPAISLDSLPSKTPKSQTKCRCKPRNNCDDKHIDYSFGFHCSYDKVRCCEPFHLVQKELEQQQGGRVLLLRTEDQLIEGGGDNNYQSAATIINSFQNAYEIDEEDIGSNNCLCVPQMDCNIKLTNNEITKRRDLACPFDFIQCCGAAININKDIRNESTSNYNYRSDIDGSDLISTDDNTFIEGRGNTYNIGGSRQSPIQLPKLIVPADADQSPSIYEETTVQPLTTQQPPNLPTHYDQNQLKQNLNGQIYYQQALRPIQQTQNQNYFKGQMGIASQTQNYQPVMYYNKENPNTQFQNYNPYQYKQVYGSSARNNNNNDESFFGSVYKWFTT